MLMELSSQEGEMRLTILGISYSHLAFGDGRRLVLSKTRHLGETREASRRSSMRTEDLIYKPCRRHQVRSGTCITIAGKSRGSSATPAQASGESLRARLDVASPELFFFEHTPTPNYPLRPSATTSPTASVSSSPIRRCPHNPFLSTPPPPPRWATTKATASIIPETHVRGWHYQISAVPFPWAYVFPIRS